MDNKIYVYAVYDIKAKIFDLPFFTRGDLFARRRFIIDIRTRKESMLSSFKEDYELHRIGEYDQESGYVKNYVDDTAETIIVCKGKELEE